MSLIETIEEVTSRPLDQYTKKELIVAVADITIAVAELNKAVALEEHIGNPDDFVGSLMAREIVKAIANVISILDKEPEGTTLADLQKKEVQMQGIAHLDFEPEGF